MRGSRLPRRFLPLFNVATASGGLIVTLHAARLAAPDTLQLEWLRAMAFVPARLWRFVAPDAAAARLAAAARSSPEAGQAAAFWLGEGLAPWSALTYAGVHVDWLHALTNAAMIAAFGAPVARRLSPRGFLGLLALGALCGAAAQASALDAAFAPLVGASACVSALIGALARLWTEPEPVRLTPLREAARRPPSLAAFAAGVLAMLGGAALGDEVAAIGWRAHLAGFVCGFVLIGALARRRKADGARSCRSQRTEASLDSD